MGMFDDLVPGQQAQPDAAGGLFDDLIPASPAAAPTAVDKKKYPYSADNPPDGDNAFVKERKIVNGKEYRLHQPTGAIYGPDDKATDDPDVMAAFGKTKLSKRAQARADINKPQPDFSPTSILDNAISSIPGIGQQYGAAKWAIQTGKEIADTPQETTDALANAAQQPDQSSMATDWQAGTNNAKTAYLGQQIIGLRTELSNLTRTANERPDDPLIQQRLARTKDAYQRAFQMYDEASGQQFPQNPAFAALHDNSIPGTAAQKTAAALRADPWGVARTLTLQSGPVSIPSVAGGIIGSIAAGRAGAALGAGVPSAYIEAGLNLRDQIAARGADMNDPASRRATFEKYADEIIRDAQISGLIVGAGDAAGAAFGSGVAALKGEGTGNLVGKELVGTIADALFGAAGEGGKQVYNTGEISDPQSLIDEGLGEVVAGGVQQGGMMAVEGLKSASGKTDRQAPPPKGQRIEPRLFDDLVPQPQAQPPAGNKGEKLATPQPEAAPADPMEEADILRQTGYSLEQIADMNPAERAQATQEARQQGIEPIGTIAPDAPAPGTSAPAPGFGTRRQRAPGQPDMSEPVQPVQTPQAEATQQINVNNWVGNGINRVPPVDSVQPVNPIREENSPRIVRPADSVQPPGLTVPPRQAPAQGPIVDNSAADKAFDSFMASRKPITQEAFAAASGLDLKEAGRAIQRAALAGRVIQGRNGNWRRPPTRSTPIDALDFIASIGGIQDVTGELAGMNLPKIGPFGPAVRKNGLHPDKVREALVEAGYLNDPARGTGRPSESTIDDLYQLLDAHMRGRKTYSTPQDQAASDAIDVTKKNENANPDYVPVHPIAQRFGMETWAKLQAFFTEFGSYEEAWSQGEIADAARLVSEGWNADDAFERAAFLHVDAIADPEQDMDPELTRLFANNRNFATVAVDHPPFPDTETPNAVQQPGPQEAGAGVRPAGDESSDASNQAEDAGPATQVPDVGESGSEAGIAVSEEVGADNLPQTVIPGAEAVSAADAAKAAKAEKARKELEARRKQSKLRKSGQESLDDQDGGLFGGKGPKQSSLLDAPAAPEPKSPTPPSHPDRLVIQTGVVLRTKSGRETSPAPKIEATNNRKTLNTIKRMQTWLLDEARKEVANDEWQTLLLKGIDVDNLSQSDQDHINLVLFGDSDGATSQNVVRVESGGKGPKQSSLLDAPEPQPETQAAFDAEKWNKDRADRIAASRAAGKTHLDKIEPAVETMRGLAIYNVHDPKERGVIRTVANTGEVVIHWSDAYSAKKNLATEKFERRGKRAVEVYESWLGPRDLKDYVADGMAARDNPSLSRKPKSATPSDATSQTEQPEAKPNSGSDKPNSVSYGTANTLVTADRAAELRAKLKAKLKGQLNAGIDPEMLAIGTELAAFHIEAGARQFVNFARAIAADLDTSIKAIRPYLRSWYNGARDMMEDAGLDVTGMDTPDQVKAALADLDKENNDGQSDGVRTAAPGVSGTEQPDDAQEIESSGQAGGARQDDRPPSGGNVRESVSADADEIGSPDGLPQESAGPRINPADGGRNRAPRNRAAAKPASVDTELQDAEAERTARRALDYRITDADEIGQGGPKQKVARNIEAIRTLKTILEEKRQATPDEKTTLVRYVGWGAFAQDVFAKHKPEWQKERAALADLLTAEEFASARASTLNAHYTSADVIKGMWSALSHLGFKGGRALEPSAGVGHFIGLTPDAVHAQTEWSAVELDTITGNIAKLLYAGSDVNVTGFEKFNRPMGFYDLAVSNVPFGDYTLRDTKRPAMLIHDYFFVKGLDLVRPGGVVAFITSSGTLDKQTDSARREMAKRADFIGAIRLPGGKNGAFSGNAGTAVTTDIIFLRRKAGGLELPNAPKWLGLKQIETPDGPIAINEYFAANPNMMLGEMRLTGTMYRDKSPVLVGDAENLQARIAEAARSMPEGVMLPRSTAPKVKETATVEADGEGKEGGYFIKDGKLYRKIEGVGRPENLAGTETEKIRMLLPIRDAINQLLSNQGRGITKGNAELRTTLNKAYDAFVRKYGPINLENVTVTNRVTRSGDFVTITKRPNFSKFSFDPDAFKVAAIENYDPDTKKATKAAIFDSDILGTPPQPQIATDADAIGWSLNAFGKLDIPQMALLTGKSELQLVRDLGDLVYENPSTGEHEPAAQYLAGDVVSKLDDARGAAESDPRRYARNVGALEHVQPEPLSRDDIRVPFGAPWVPSDVYTAFFRDELDSDVTLSMNPISKKWQIKSARFSSAASTKYATARMPMDKIVEHAIQMTPPRVTVRDQDGKEILLKEETEEAMVRVGNLRDAFSGSFDGAVQGWIWNDDERAVRLEALYNKSFNRLVPQKFDGSHLTFPGLTATITDSAGQKVPFRLRDHQKNAVARIIQNGNTLLDHVVGAGKTFTMIAAGMEQRRLGQTQRPMFIVPNHMLEQFSREFLQAYPGANILVAQKDEMTRENRKAFAAKIASQKWDGIIITHDAFGRMAMSNEAYIEFTQAEIAQVLQAKENAAIEEGKKSPTIKDLEKLQKRLETKLAQLQNKERKDDGVIFEELGVDQLYLDEAHLFKNLSFFTRHTRIKGIGGTASQRATDLFMKIRHLEKTRPGRSAVFATGTPISNTMAEMFTMQRYLQGDTLKDYGVDEFDAWAATFGEVKSAMELGPDGRTLRETTSFSRFINIPELVAMYSRVADSQTADMLNLPRPKRKNGRITIEEAEFSDAEEQRALAIVRRAMDLKGKKAEKGMDNMLKVVGDGRKLATDVRLLDPNAPYNPNGKTARLIANVFDRWKDAKFPAIAQMIFLDMGVPQSKATAKPVAISEDEDFSEDADSDAAEALASRFDLYADIRDRLVSRGIPREQIAFIHEANDDTKKARMFAKVRNGEIRVLMGSTGKMGVGTNVQRLLTALHHDDAPWKPAEVEQRDGRIERQGNLNEEIEIIRYVTKKSMDAFMWQTLERKAAFIGQLKAGAKGVRHAEDIDSPLPEAADMKAAATGDPRIMEQAEITKRARELTVAKSNHTRVQTESKRQSFLTKARITHLEGEVAKMQKDAPLVKPTTGDAFTINLDFGRGQRTFTTRKDAGEAIRRWALDRGRTMWGPPRKEDIGQISGLGVSMALQQTEDGVQYAFTIEGNVTYGQPVMNVLTDDADPLGLVRRIENILKEVPAMLAYQQAELDRARVTLTKLEAAAVEKPFPRQREYDEVHDRLKVLNAELKAEGEAAQRKTPPSSASPQQQEPLSSRRPNKFRYAISDKQRRAVVADVQQAAQRILGHHLQKVVTALDLAPLGFSSDEDGVFDPNTGAIYIALQGAQDPRSTIRHEAIHALRQAGVFTKPEWAALSRMAVSQWIDQYNIRDRYESLYRERFDLTDAQIEELLTEEAVADAFADYTANPRGEDLISRIFEKLRQFLASVRSMLKGQGFTTADQVFSNVDRGRMGTRAAGVGTSREFMLYGRQDSLGQDVTKTEAFKRWFGDSKVVDAQGRPLVVYHGTGSDFGEFKPSRSNVAIWMTPNPSVAERFATGDLQRWGQSPNVMPLYASMQNPFDPANPPRHLYDELDALLIPPWANKTSAKRISKSHRAEWAAGDFQSIFGIGNGFISEPIRDFFTARGIDGLIARNPDGSVRAYAAFSPTQIKSVFNNGTFDPKNPAILSSRGRQAPPRNPAQGSFEAPHDERVRKALFDSTDTLLSRIRRAAQAGGVEFRRKVQDREIDLLRTQGAITQAAGPIAEPQDAYLAASLYPGRVAQRDRDLVSDVIEPLVEDIAKRGLTLDEVDQFNRARHAFERNLEIGKLYKPGQQFHDAMFNPSIVGGSGMSDDQASDILNAAQQSGKYADLEAVGDKIVSLNAKTLDKLLAEGLIEQDYYDTLKKKYRYYVPLRGHEESADDTHPDSPRTGSRYDIRGKEFQQAFGRTSAADSTLAYSILQARQAIIRIEKNRVGKRFLRLAQANPNEAFWQVNRKDMKKVIDKNTGLVRNVYDPGTTQAENVYAVKVGGKAYHVTIHHEGLLKAMKGIGAENMHGLVLAFYKINRFLAGMNTSYDPEFIFRNLLRDLQQTGIVLQEEKIKGLTRNVVMSMPKAAAGMNAMLRGDTNTEWSRWARDYADAGGKMGFMGRNDIESEKASLEKLMKEQNPSASLKAWMVLRDEVAGRLDRYNDSIENTLRLATYVHMRKAGISKDKAAFAARELTVNFNRKGEWSSGINAFYMFFNAAMQGGASMAMRLARSKTVRRVAYGIMVTAFLQDMLNRMLAGDDDDGENRYDKIPDEIKAKNGIIMFPKWAEEKYGVPYLKWPLPLGYNMFHIAGTQAGHVVAGSRTPLEAAGETVGAVADAFNPLGGGGTILNFFAPTILDPAADIATNTDYFGENIMPRSYDDTQPNSDRYKPNVNPTAKFITDFLNEATGGSPERKGAIDWSPEWVEHIWDFAAGGVGRLISRTSTVADTLIKGDDLDANKVPFARVFTGQSNKFTDRDTYNEIKDAVHVTEKEIEARRAEGNTQEAERVAKKYAREVRMIEIMKTAEKQMTKLRKDYRAMKAMQGIGDAQRKERLDEISRRMDAIQLNVRQRWNSPAMTSTP